MNCDFGEQDDVEFSLLDLLLKPLILVGSTKMFTASGGSMEFLQSCLQQGRVKSLKPKAEKCCFLAREPLLMTVYLALGEFVNFVLALSPALKLISPQTGR